MSPENKSSILRGDRLKTESLLPKSRDASCLPTAYSRPEVEPAVDGGEASSDRYFRVGRVDTNGPLWTAVRRLRYEVYCLECGFLDASAYPEGMESDLFDPYSVHFAARDISGEVAATLRLVLDSTHGFPLEARAERLDPEYGALPRSRTAEISRLIVAPKYRRRTHDGLYGGDVGAVAHGAQESHPRSRYPLVLFGLFREMYVYSLEAGLEYWLAAMETGLQRLLGRFGLGLRQIGAPMAYYGEVVPYFARIADLSERIRVSRPDVFRFVARGGA